MSENINEILETKDHSDHKELSNNSTDFNTLLFIGKFVSFVGWILFFVGIIIVLNSLGSESRGMFGGRDNTWIAGLISIVFGVLTIAQGQIISCFVSIEKNTKNTFNILKEFVSKK